MSIDNSKLKFYKADIKDNKLFLGTNFLGVEEYIGLYRKSNWQNPILITKDKNGYFSLKEILIDRYKDGSYIIFSKNSIPSFIDRSILFELQNIVSSAKERQVPISQFGAEIPLHEEELFRHAIQYLDDKLFDSFSIEKSRNKELNISDFSNMTSSNSQDNTTIFSDSQSIISKMLNDYYKEIDMCEEINPFKKFNPLNDNKVAKEFRLYGFNFSLDEIKKITLDMNRKIVEYLYKKLESNLIQMVRQNLVSKKNVALFRAETLNNYGISLPSVRIQELLTKINHMIESYYQLNRNEEISERNIQFAYGAISAFYLNLIDKSESVNPFDDFKIPDEKEVEEIFRVNNALLTDEQVSQITVRLSDTLTKYAIKKLINNLISMYINEINLGNNIQQLDSSVIMSYVNDEETAQRIVDEVNFAVNQYMNGNENLFTNEEIDALSGYGSL